MLDARGDFIYKHERYTGYSIGKIILDIRTDIVEVDIIWKEMYGHLSLNLFCLTLVILQYKYGYNL